MERFAISSATVRRALSFLVLTVCAAIVANRLDTAGFVLKPAPGESPLTTAAAPMEFVRLLPGVLRPVGVAVAADGRIVVTDSTSPLAKAFVPGGNDLVLEPMVGGPDEPGAAPFGVAVDDAGDIYVSDLNRKEVLVYRAGSLQPSPFAGPEWDGRRPGAMFARGGRLYVVDIQNHQIVVIEISDERRVAVIGTGLGSGPTELRFPNGIWVSPEGVVYVADSNNDRIQRFGPDGDVMPSWEGSFRNPRGLAGDDRGRIYVANTLAHEILIIDDTGAVVDRVVRAGVREIGFPTGLAVAGDRLFVTDRDAHGVFEWRMTEERRTP